MAAVYRPRRVDRILGDGARGGSYGVQRIGQISPRGPVREDQLSPTQNTIPHAYARRLLNEIAAHARITNAGSPIRFTPHDFRRLFATELVGSGLPLHIVSTLLGHLNLETTRGYTAVFPEQVIEAHHRFIERRRLTRPQGEMRAATSEEWSESEQHFLPRKVALGDCHVDQYPRVAELPTFVRIRP